MNFPKLDTSSIWNLIKQSCTDHLNKLSSTRINGYWMSVLFTACVLCCIGIEITSAIVCIHKNDTYTVSGQFLSICGMILAQQGLLFHLKKQSEKTSFPTVEKLNDLNNSNTLPNT